MGGIGDARALLLIRDLPIKVADHSVKLGEHRFNLPNPAALLFKLKALQTHKRVPRLHSCALLNKSRRERTSPSLAANYETAGRCMTKVSPFLRQVRTGSEVLTAAAAFGFVSKRQN